MLSGEKLRAAREASELSVVDVAKSLTRSGLDERKAATAIRNWEKGLLKPRPKAADIEKLTQALACEREDLLVWKASHMYAPIAPRKARLVTSLIAGRPVHEALELLKFANKRAAVMVDKVLRSAIAGADEQEVDIERLVVSQARVDEGGIRLGTRRWRPKDRGRAVSWTRLASHIHVSVDVD